MTDKPDIERDSFNELMTNHRLKALAARIEAPQLGGRPDGTLGVPAVELPAPPAGNLGVLAGVVCRLTFSEMMTLTEGITRKLPGQNGPGALEPFALAIGLRDWAAE